MNRKTIYTFQNWSVASVAPIVSDLAIRRIKFTFDYPLLTVYRPDDLTAEDWLKNYLDFRNLDVYTP